MARKFAQVPVMIWGRDSFRSLSVGAQRLYLLLSTSPTTTMAGVADWRPARTVSLGSDSTIESLTVDMEELVAAELVKIDAETEEVWLTPMILDDGLLRGPKTTAGLVSAWAVIGSKYLRGEIAQHVREVILGGVPPSVEHMLKPLAEYGWEEPVVKPKRVPVPPERPKKAKASRFDEFWNAYPRQEGKLGAQRKYEIAVAKVGDEQIIIDGAIKYAVARHGQDTKFTKLPTTWLNNGCWDDKIEEVSQGDLYNPENGWA